MEIMIIMEKCKVTDKERGKETEDVEDGLHTTVNCAEIKKTK